jgi:hypothetical protein
LIEFPSSSKVVSGIAISLAELEPSQMYCFSGVLSKNMSFVFKYFALFKELVSKEERRGGKKKVWKKKGTTCNVVTKQLHSYTVTQLHFNHLEVHPLYIACTRGIYIYRAQKIV